MYSPAFALLLLLADVPKKTKQSFFVALTLVVGQRKLIVKMSHTLVVLVDTDTVTCKATLSETPAHSPLLQWTHIAMVYSESGGMKLYVNSELLASSPAGKPLGNDGPMSLSFGTGSSIMNQGSSTQSSVASARLWRCERLQSDIKEGMRTMVPSGSIPALVGQWRLNEGFGMCRCAAPTVVVVVVVIVVVVA
jgi:hypothetical protein